MKTKIILIFIMLTSLQLINNSAAFGGDNINSQKMIILGEKDYIKNILKNNEQTLLKSIDINNENEIYDKSTYAEYFKLMNKEEWEFYSKLIPEEFMVSFMYFTKDKPYLRPLVYAIMKHESINFLEFTNINKNGTIDHGPMMLNSSNLNNDLFMKLYSPDKDLIKNMGYDINDQIGKYNFYIGISINLLVDLIEKYTERGNSNPITLALRAYNGGENVNTYRASSYKVAKTTRYAKKVLSIYFSTLNQYDSFTKQITIENSYL